METNVPSLASLSDRQLLAHVEMLAAKERGATAALIASLAELDARRLHLDHREPRDARQASTGAGPPAAPGAGRRSGGRVRPCADASAAGSRAEEAGADQSSETGAHADAWLAPCFSRGQAGGLETGRSAVRLRRRRGQVQGTWLPRVPSCRSLCRWGPDHRRQSPTSV
jgi:hypothetical protein